VGKPEANVPDHSNDEDRLDDPEGTGLKDLKEENARPGERQGRYQSKVHFDVREIPKWGFSLVLKFLKRFERSVAIERLERLEQPVRFLIAAAP
jgi:hypothetical protein